jgi:hypothetical protein
MLFNLDDMLVPVTHECFFRGLDRHTLLCRGPAAKRWSGWVSWRGRNAPPER